jgi:hypothetical protein
VCAGNGCGQAEEFGEVGDGGVSGEALLTPPQLLLATSVLDGAIESWARQ